MTRFHFGRHRSSSVLEARTETGSIVDVTGHTVVQVNISIHDTPHYDDRIGEALCLVSGDSLDSSGAVVPINRHPHRVTRAEFARLIEQARHGGHLLDDFFEIQASIDVTSGEIVWQPENGLEIHFDNLDEIVENTFASLVETNLFGQWFSARSVQRRVVIN